jgi:hypothetical protein
VAVFRLTGVAGGFLLANDGATWAQIMRAMTSEDNRRSMATDNA